MDPIKRDVLKLTGPTGSHAPAGLPAPVGSDSGKPISPVPAAVEGDCIVKELGELDCTVRQAVNKTAILIKFNTFVRERTKLLTDAQVSEKVLVVNSDVVDYVYGELKRETRWTDDEIAEFMIDNLIHTQSLKIKGVLAPVAYFIDQDKFANKYLIPAMEGRPTFELSVNNKKFTIKYLQELAAKNEILKLFSPMDFSKINNREKFIDSLLEVENHEAVLSALADLLAPGVGKDGEVDKFRLFNQNSRRKDHNYIEAITLSYVQKLVEKKIALPKEALKKFYSNISAHDDDNLDAVAKLLNEKSEIPIEERIEFFASEMNRSETNEEVSNIHNKKFYATRHLTQAGGERSIDALRKFVLTSDDSALVNYACWQMAELLGDNGKSKFLDIVHESISRGKESLPLAYIMQMFSVSAEDKYIKMFRGLTERPYIEGRGLAEAIETTSGRPIGKIVRTASNSFSFYNETDSWSEDVNRSQSVLDVIEFLKIGSLSAWASSNSTSKENIVSMFKFAKRENESKLVRLIAQARSFRPEHTTLKFILELGNMGLCGLRADEFEGVGTTKFESPADGSLKKKK